MTEGKRPILTTREMCVFALLGGLMFALKTGMEFLPNIHPVGVLTCVYTLVYRKKALFPIYIYVLCDGLIHGFSAWWAPYLYIWAVLWGAVMLLPRNMPARFAVPAYMVVCGLHGWAFGLMYLPFQALMFNLTAKQAAAWLAAGFWFDFLHGCSNFGLAALVLPLKRVMMKLK